MEFFGVFGDFWGFLLGVLCDDDMIYCILDWGFDYAADFSSQFECYECDKRWFYV